MSIKLHSGDLAVPTNARLVVLRSPSGVDCGGVSGNISRHIQTRHRPQYLAHFVSYLLSRLRKHSMSMLGDRASLVPHRPDRRRALAGNQTSVHTPSLGVCPLQNVRRAGIRRRCSIIRISSPTPTPTPSCRCSGRTTSRRTINRRLDVNSTREPSGSILLIHTNAEILKGRSILFSHCPTEVARSPVLGNDWLIDIKSRPSVHNRRKTLHTGQSENSTQLNMLPKLIVLVAS
ncbi:hypothetical protein DFH07DRAFT_300261 [Mycena maculata]|uniref:Uncharacterized protein n=1 Tax=Mycena maculata TaxID=230809 RepID=A0AAD7JNY9_9AGAR|nr:hypothetical protein DFH07DRAFT_300261 [Mycena maculata]